jgi:hypothetical protein
VDAGEDLHQGALAGAVLADQAVDLPRPEVELDVVERGRAAEPLGDPAQPQERRDAVGGGHGGEAGHGAPGGDRA